MAIWCRDCWEERLGFFQCPSPLLGWEVLEKSARENHIKDQLRNEKHQNYHSQTPEEPSAVAGTSCILLPHSRDRTTQIQQTQWQTLNYINHLGLQTYVCGSDLTISRFFHLNVLTCCSSTFTVCTGRLGRLCLTNWLNLNLAAFREILSLSGVPMYMSSCCSWSPLPPLSFLHKQHYLARNYLSQTLQLGSNLTCEISDSAAMTCISQFVHAADLAYWKFMSHVFVKVVRRRVSLLELLSLSMTKRTCYTVTEHWNWTFVLTLQTLHSNEWDEESESNTNQSPCSFSKVFSCWASRLQGFKKWLKNVASS